MAGFCKRKSYTGRVPAQVLAQRLRYNPADRGARHRGGQGLLRAIVRQAAAAANEQLGDFDDAIAAAVAEHRDAPIFASFPGVGPVLTTVLLAEIGEDRNGFPRPEALLTTAGLAPVTRASRRSKQVRLRYASNMRLNAACMWWAFDSLKVSPWAATAFRKHATKPDSATTEPSAACPLDGLRILWRCWTDQTS